MNTILRASEESIARQIGRGGEEFLETETAQLLKSTKALEAAGITLTDAQKQLLKSAESATTSELRSATNGFKNEVTSSEHALEAAMKANRAADLQRATGSRIRDTLFGVGAVTTAAGGAGSLLYPVITGTNRIDKGLEAIGRGLTSGADEAAATIDSAKQKAEDIAEGLANHIPNTSDITEAADAARNAAHNITAALPAAETAITIGAVLLGAVVVYEAYRYFNR